jgi:2',3'-cyclic-nucleotide 2'-phosphodiesterase (5'-nucleotidase family)
VRALVPALALVLLAACSSATKRSDGGRPPNKSTDITLFFTTELKGTLEPCGCTSDPLGDIARTAAAIEAARKERPVALFDGGSTLYLDLPVPEEGKAQAELTADAVARLLPDLGLKGAGLGPHDLGRGPQGVRLARDAVNVTGGVSTTPPRIVEIGGGRVGVFGVVSPGAVEPLGLTASDAGEAARQAIATLRGDGAQLVVALAHMPRAEARRLARSAPGIDLLLVGKDVHDEGAAPEAVGGTFLSFSKAENRSRASSSWAVSRNASASE